MGPLRQAEDLVLDPHQLAALAGEVPPAPQPHGVAIGGPVEGLGHRGPPVHHQGLEVWSGHGQAADVVAGAPTASVAGQEVYAAEAERLVPDVQLLQAVEA